MDTRHSFWYAEQTVEIILLGKESSKINLPSLKLKAWCQASELTA